MTVDQGDGLYGPVQTRINILTDTQLEDLDVRQCEHPETSVDIHVHVRHRGKILTATTSRSCGRCGLMITPTEIRTRVTIPEGPAAWGELVHSILGVPAWSKFSSMVARLRRQIWVPRHLVDRYEVTDVDGLPELRVKGEP